MAYRTGVIAGAISILGGILLLLRVSDLWAFWPLIPIVLGLTYIARTVTPSTIVWGGLAAAVGTLFFLDNLSLAPVDFTYVWPMLIVACGVTMVWKAEDASRSH